jgi:uncharacterized protein YecE (DUF72 family)
MEFGKIEPEKLKSIDLSLPPELAVNKSVLTKSKKTAPKIYVGCPEWGKKEWVGRFYPPGTQERDFLYAYARLFNCIELNTTYYQIPAIAQVQKWRTIAGPGFKFCPKFPQFITHVQRLTNCMAETMAFINAISAFEDSLGPLFLMPHPQMGPNSLGVIEKFIAKLPAEIDLFLELRHPAWFTNGLNKQLYDIAKRYDIGLIITDAAGRRDCVHMHLSKPEAFIRFVGNELHPTDYTRIDDWVNRIKLWLDEGLIALYFFMHLHNRVDAPVLSKYLVEKLNQICHLHLTVPQMHDNQGVLF